MEEQYFADRVRLKQMLTTQPQSTVREQLAAHGIAFKSGVSACGRQRRMMKRCCTVTRAVALGHRSG